MHTLKRFYPFLAALICGLHAHAATNLISGLPATATFTNDSVFLTEVNVGGDMKSRKITGNSLSNTLMQMLGINLKQLGSANLTNWSGVAPSTKADVASPAFTGNPTAPNQALTDSDTSIANTAFALSNAVAQAALRQAGSSVLSNLTTAGDANLTNWAKLQTNVAGGSITYSGVTNALGLTGSTSTYLRSDGTQVAPAGTGDWKADGSVTATGDFNMGGKGLTNVAFIITSNPDGTNTFATTITTNAYIAGLASTNLGVDANGKIIAVAGGSVSSNWAALTVNDDAYASGWNGSTNVPTKNAIYDKIESMATSGGSATNVFSIDVDAFSTNGTPTCIWTGSVATATSSRVQVQVTGAGPTNSASYNLDALFRRGSGNVSKTATNNVSVLESDSNMFAYLAEDTTDQAAKLYVGGLTNEQFHWLAKGWQWSLTNHTTTAAGGGSYPGFTYDIRQDFESALSSPWSETDGSSILNPQNASAKYVGTYGMSCASGSAAEAYVAWDPSGTYSSVSAGWWYYAGTYASWAGDKTICRGLDGADNTLFFIREGRSAGDNTRRLTWDLDADTVTVSDATWYWITFVWTSSGTCQLRVYDTALSQVGSTMSATGGAAQLGKWWWGSYGVSSTTTTYFDDIFIDYADATFPLLPSSTP